MPRGHAIHKTPCLVFKYLLMLFNFLGVDIIYLLVFLNEIIATLLLSLEFLMSPFPQTTVVLRLILIKQQKKKKTRRED